MFTLGFKTAAFDHNNQGQEFKMSDMGSGNVGPGGMAPSGIESYQPAGDSPKKEDKKIAARKAMLAMYKLSGSDIASGTVDQLKWTSENGPNLEQEADDRKELKNRRKSYLKARIRE